uniref:Baseplate wedge subunit n=1 Tax=Ochrobactrum phage ORM_20 TaxID=2985243 RepID=A0A9N6WU46_9VIRU|nr:baseplate wedge subunit [Ochrobactrum phage ORM_20]
MAAGYFRNFPVETFEFDGDRYSLEDLTRKVVYSPEMFDNGVQIEQILLTGERPDMLAHILYSDSNLWWTFFVVNNITMNEWPMSEEEMDDYMNSFFTPWQLEQTKEHIDENGVTVPSVGWKYFKADGKDVYHGFNPSQFNNPNPVGLQTGSNGERITLREYLHRRNDARKKIFVIRRTFIKDFVDDFIKKLKGEINYALV